MAKLSAHGTEVARLDITRTVPEREYRVVYSFRSDGHVLRRIAVGTDGWKLYTRLRSPKFNTIERMRAHALRLLRAAPRSRGQATASRPLDDGARCTSTRALARAAAQSALTRPGDRASTVDRRTHDAR